MTKTAAILKTLRETDLDNAPAIADHLGLDRAHVAMLMNKLGSQKRVIRNGAYRVGGLGVRVHDVIRWKLNTERPHGLCVRPPARRVPFAGADGVGNPRSWG